MHGGGYIAGDKQYKNPLLAKIAEQGYIVVNVNYALAPQYKYPTPLIQMNQATQFIKENKMNLPIDFNQVIIGSNTAGAQLASQFTAIQTNDRLREAMKFGLSHSNHHKLKALYYLVVFIICKQSN